MKALLYTALVLLVGNAYSQNCNEYIHFRKGASFEMETYDAKGTKLNKIESTVKEVGTSAGNTEAVIHTVTYDKANVKENEGDFKAFCLTDKIMFDISSLLKSDKMGGADNNMEIKVESGYLEITKDLAIGQTIPDNQIKIKMSEKKSGNAFGVTNITIQDKKVEAKETISTPAGAYSCYKITFNSKIEVKLAMNNMTMPAQIYPGVYYISKEVGLVKAVNLGNKKAVRSYTLLTKVKK